MAVSAADPDDMHDFVTKAARALGDLDSAQTSVRSLRASFFPRGTQGVADDSAEATPTGASIRRTYDVQGLPREVSTPLGETARNEERGRVFSVDSHGTAKPETRYLNPQGHKQAVVTSAATAAP